MKTLLLATALIEVAAGAAAIFLPAIAVQFLLGSPLESPQSIAITRVAGAALVSLAIICWIAHHDPSSRTSRAVIPTMLFYNIAVVAFLLYARLANNLSGTGLWPAIVLHAIMAAWCAAQFRTPALKTA